MTPPIRVLIVDDDPLVRAGLTMILGGAADLDLVGEAVDGIDAVDRVAELGPDVVLMDIRMPRRDGLAATRLLQQRTPAPRIIVLTTFDTDASVLAALRLGAAGFLLKDTPPADIVEAIRRVAAGDPILSPRITAQLIATVAAPERADRSTSARQRLARLTEREREVALAIGRGRSNSEIAAELYLSLPTVKAHVSRIFTKLQTENRVQIAICVHDAGLV